MTGFGWLLHAEWTKFRTVRGWVLAMAVAAAAIVWLGLFPGLQGSCGGDGPDSECILPVGPDGRQVTDSFTFVHQPLAGDGSVTARVTSLTGRLYDQREGLAPWAKAGLIIKDGTRQGSTYAAVMVTADHGVRMQYDYTHDRAGQPDGALPRWLRLTRAGATITGYESADGANWSTVGTVNLRGLPSTVQIGLFTTSPQYVEVVSESIGVTAAAGGPSRATATFDNLDRQGTWTADVIGGPDNTPEHELGGFERTADGFTLTGSGDIAPAVAGAAGIGATITQTLVGTFAGLIILVVVGIMFITAEYRRGLIRTTVAASPQRGRILAAKAVVLGGITFLTGLAAAAVVVILGQRVLRGNGVYVHPVTALTELRVVAGTAALLAVAALLALGVGALLRRGVTAVAAAILVIILPYLLAVATVLPTGSAADWLLRVTPAAAFAIQQSTPQYSQVDNLYLPVDGYFPLPPWAGFGVLVGWAAAALGLAAYRFRRRDA
jgi:ABC-type transport system involved in multi-copper enzyme maturation permease subunit/regulation of enolase protein 1 (concanavalin A-like superfamily)